MGTLGDRWATRHGIQGLNGINGHREAVLPVARRVRLSGVGQDPEWYDPAAVAVEPASYDYTTPGYAYDPAFASDWGPGAPSSVVGLPDGSSVDLTGASTLYDPASGQHYTLAADGTKVFDDGTVLKPGGDIMTPGGTVVHPNGSLTLPTGELVAASTTTVDGLSVATQLSQWIKVGGDITTGVSGILSKLGIIEQPRPPAGAPRPGWVTATTYRTAAGQVVTPTKLPNGLYQLPDGSTVGAPPGAGTGTLLLVGGVAAAAFLFFRKRAV